MPFLTFSPTKLAALHTRIAYLPPEADHVAALVAAAKGTHATEAEALAYAAALRARRPLPERRRLLST